ncbi:MAG: type II toxin-antitoxin system Phd/YefM family antitoxin [Gammaproteobacteria bacterium]|nr:MAG: type II toxin-antitoxin system Phd/YefM family antitoxin [Gammaproteobacteria bacterium]UTW42240.1 type II toxin-antitoxin system Phd/YefM family antitoxin [bacterium SCSIO 12844]
MTVKTITSREFNQDVSKAKKSATKGPVFITDRGKLAHVLLTAEAYQKLLKKDNIVNLLSMPEACDIDFDAPKLTKRLYKPEDFE